MKTLFFRVTFAFMCLFLHQLSFLLAQTDTIQANTLKRKAEFHKDLNQVDSAKTSYHQAAKLYLEIARAPSIKKNRKLLEWAYGQYYECKGEEIVAPLFSVSAYWQNRDSILLQQIKALREEAQQFLPLGHRTFHSLDFLLAFLHFKSESYFESYKILSRLKTQLDPSLPEEYPLYIKCLSILEGTFTQTQQNNQAIEILEEIIKREEQKKKGSLILIRSYSNLGYNYSALGMLNKCLDSYEKALGYYRQVKGNEPSRVLLSILYNIADTYIDLGRHKDSFEYLEECLSIALKVLPPSHPMLGNIYNALGTVYLKMFDVRNAEIYYQKVIEFTQNNNQEKSTLSAGAYINLGKCYDIMASYDLAIEYISKGYFLMVELGYAYHEYTINALKSIALINYKNQKLNLALKQLDQAIGLCYRQPLESNFHLNQANFFSVSTLVPIKVIELLSLKVMALAKLNSFNSQQDELVKQNISSAEFLCDSLINNAQNHKDKVELSYYRHFICKSAILYASNKWENSEGWKEFAWKYFEKSKSNVLQSLLNEEQALHFSDIPDSLLKLEKTLKHQINELESFITKERLKCPECDYTLVDQKHSQKYRAQKNYEELLQKFSVEYPKYYNLKHNKQYLTLDSLQKSLLKEKHNTAILSYHIADSMLAVACITKNEVVFRKFNLTFSRYKGLSDIEVQSIMLARTLRSSYSYLDTVGSIAVPAHKLYEALIQPFEPYLKGKELLIIPDSWLFKVPFEVLVTQLPKHLGSKDYQKLDYLIRHYPITYHYSATLAKQIYEKSTNFIATKNIECQSSTFTNCHKGSTDKSWLGVAPVYFLAQEQKIKEALASISSRYATSTLDYNFILRKLQGVI